MPDPQPAKKGLNSGELIAIVAVVGVALAAYAVHASQSSSSSSTGMQFTEPDPNSVAALAAASAAGVQAQQSSLSNIAALGASVATTLANNDAQIRLQQISSSAQTQQNAITAGSTIDLANIQAAMQELINQQNVAGEENITSITTAGQQAIAQYSTSAAATMAADQEQAAEQASSNSLWASIADGILGTISALVKLPTGGSAAPATSPETTSTSGLVLA